MNNDIRKHPVYLALQADLDKQFDALQRTQEKLEVATWIGDLPETTPDLNMRVKLMVKVRG